MPEYYFDLQHILLWLLGNLMLQWGGGGGESSIPSRGSRNTPS